MKKIFSIVALTLLFVSCENDIKSNSPAFQGEKDNVFWRADDSKVTINAGGTVSINAYTDKELVGLTVPDAVGVYNLGTADQSINASYSYNNEGSVSYYETSLIEGPVYKLGAFTSFGTGYASLNGNNVNTSGGSGNGLTLKITTNTGGNVIAATIASRGTGYSPGDIVTINGGNANAAIKILSVMKSNGVVEIEKIEGNAYSGTFSFNAVDENGNVVNFNKGTFYKVPAF
ncbi:DUF6252 family protein [Flavobacterium terrigena]|uniref:Lipoprotein n=1 Tax=Flavobacterium terrigena TaxID=402734 RepID=A0A1H6X9S8_9FLAO|nr:DUF6252 family protein [Flavobacterium terrigena]SEJ25899.1 hypothetical protein SAMN05660918_2776 [Flavobacterium terrigena]